MVKSLRVVELRFLLSAMGGYAKGLKKDLVQRATKLLRDNFHPQLFSTIQELYDHRHSTGNANSKRSQIITMRTVVEVAADSPMKSSGPVHDPKVHMSKLPFYQTLETIFSPVSLGTAAASSLSHYVFKIWYLDQLPFLFIFFLLNFRSSYGPTKSSRILCSAYVYTLCPGD